MLVAVIAGFAILFRDQLSLANLASYETHLRQLTESNRGLSYAGAFVLYVIVTAFSLPGAAAMSIVIGWLFGADSTLAWPAVLLVSFASTTGASARVSVVAVPLA